MRNILVFPDGNHRDFQYPADRDVEVGSSFQVQLLDDNVHVLSVDSIERTEKAIYYYLK